MFTFRNLSLRRKQMLVIMLTSSVALLLACTAFVVYDILNFRGELVEQASTTAEVVGNNCTASLDFNDPKSAGETLAALRAEPNILAACVFDGHADLFAMYTRGGTNAISELPEVKVEGYEFVRETLRMFKPIIVRGEKVGMVYLAYDLEEVTARIWSYAGIVALVLVASLLAAFLISIRLQRLVSDPILRLAQMTRSVAVEKNYSVRVAKQSEDEIGELIDGFNEMLAQIQDRDAALETAREHLEHRVEERTGELAKSLSLLNATLESTADGILVVDSKGKKILQNQQTVELWKIPAEIAHGNDDDAQVRHVMRMTTEPEKFLEQVDYFYAHPEESGRGEITLNDGTIIERITAPVLDKDGRNYGRIWTFRDITQSRRAEAALLESQALYHSLVDQMPVGIFRKDAEGRYVFVNSFFCKTLHVKPEHCLGKTAQEVFALDVTDKRNVQLDHQTAVELAKKGEGHHVQIMRTGKPIELEEKQVLTDGTTQYLHVVKTPVFDSEGRIVGTQGVQFDITDSKYAEEALRESQALYHSLVEQLPNGVFRKDYAGRYVFVNSTFCRIMELPADEVLGKTATELVAHISTARGEERRPTKVLGTQGEDHHRLILKTGRQVAVEDQYIGTDGKSYYYHTIKSAVFGPVGEIIGTQGVLFDITDRKQAEEALRESQALYDSLVEHLPAGVFRKDKEGRFVFVNTWFCRLKRMRADELLGKTPKDLAEYELSPQHLKNPAEARESIYAAQGMSHHELIMQSGRPIELEEEYPGQNGQPLHLRVVKSPVFGSSGEIVGTQGMLFDITESKRAQAELAAERELLRALLDNSPDQIYFKDLQSRFLKSSQAQAENFGVKSPDELVGKTDFDFFAEDHARPAFKDEQEIIRTGKPLIGKVEKEIWPDGRTSWVIASKMPLRNKDGEIVGTFGISKNITAIKQAEEALAYERDLLKVLMDNFPDSIYFKDLQSRFVRMSRSKIQRSFNALLEQHRAAHPADHAEALPLHLTSLEQFEKYIVGKSDFDFLPESFARTTFVEEQEIIRTGQPIVGQINQATLLNGKSAWYVSSKVPWRDQDGKIIGTFGTTKEITDLKLAQEEAAREQARLKFIFDSVPVGISLVKKGPDGQQMERLINDAHLRICGVTRDQDKDLRVYKQISHPDDYRRQMEFVRQMGEGKLDHFSMEKRYLRLDGRIAWAMFSIQRLKYSDGSCEDLCTVVDITENKRAEEEREKLHRQLLDASRAAGMAEVASNVLHNVGNVLNSVNVSATLAADIARKSKAANLTKVVGLLDQHAADLGNFFTKDSRGMQLHGYLRKLSEHLAQEQQTSIAELESLRKNIEHIKDIVTMQQNYAKMSGLKEIVMVADLVEDSLRMNDGALKRHEVQVVREYETVPPINVEKHKVLQILVNLIRNAKYACDEGRHEDKRVTVRIAKGQKGIKISVADNGIGIPAENMTRIFNHGFTTRKTGHGFGLHSGALAAKEMGGALVVESEGMGRGATFILELPLAPDSKSERGAEVHQA